MISLGGAASISLWPNPARVPAYVSTVSQIVSDYGFDGIDIDFEAPRCPSILGTPISSVLRHPRS